MESSNSFIDENIDKIKDAANLLVDRFENDGKLYIIGFGISKIVADYLKYRFTHSPGVSRPPLPSIVLTSEYLSEYTDDNSVNDYFLRNVKGLITENDSVISIVNENEPEQILSFMKYVLSINVTSIGLSGGNLGKVSGLCEVLIKPDFTDVNQVFDCHMITSSLLCKLVDKKMFGFEFDEVL